jgi:hypothetical protein
MKGGESGVPGSALARVVRRQLDACSFDAHCERFAALFLKSFPKGERRRIRTGITVVGDDGGLPGPSIEELFSRKGVRVDAYLEGGVLVGFAMSIDLGFANVGDYLACDADRPDLTGLGRRMLRDWLTDTAARDQDAVIEVEPLETAPDPEEPGLTREERRRRADLFTVRRRRRRLFERSGFRFLDEIDYALPTGMAMSVGVRPRPSRPMRLLGDAPTPVFARDELDELLRGLRATYGGGAGQEGGVREQPG